MLRYRQGVSREEGARSTGGVFVGDSFQPWVRGVRRGLADGVEGCVVGELAVSRRLGLPMQGH